MKFTQLARAKAAVIWEKNLQHPFIKELHAGTLPSAIFRYYLLQDRYYLQQLQQIYLQIAEHTEDVELQKMMVAGSERLIAGEVAIRETFFRELQITEAEIEQTPIAPTAYHYVSHMYRQLITGSPTIAFASLLPCVWLYQEIGFLLNQTGSPQPLYQRWIETCITDESVAIVRAEQEKLDQLYEMISVVDQQKMLEAFFISTQMEHAFWEMAYTLENWTGE